MVGYKVFTRDWTAVHGNGVFQYEVGGLYSEDRPPQARRNGFHFCKKVIDCFNYYEVDSRNRIAELEILGEVSENGDACSTNKMRIVRELHWADIMELIEEQEAM